MTQVFILTQVLGLFSILTQLFHVLALILFFGSKCRQGSLLVELNRPNVEHNFEAGVRIGGH
jgi:hypothetical protein